MNKTNDITSLLINNREKIVEKLLQNYNYQYLQEIFSDINAEKDNSITILPETRRLYNILSGQFTASRYSNSAINWLPSEELVTAIIDLAKYFKIERIEEVYTDLGILSALISSKNKDLKLTVIDTFQNINTCNKLDLISIANRRMSDYSYYPQLQELYPQMIISTFYPENDYGVENERNNLFVEEMTELINNENNDIILIFLPITFTNFNDYFYHLSVNSSYKIYHFYVKALDKYFDVHQMVKAYHPTSMIAHLLVRKYLNPDKKEIKSILDKAIIPNKINTNVKIPRLLYHFYHKLSPKLIKSIHRSYCYQKPYKQNKKIMDVIEKFQKIQNTNIPQYLFDINEFIFWSECVEKSLYFLFESRSQFYEFYTRSISVQILGIRSQVDDFPQWITSVKFAYIYLYLETTSNTGNWRNSEYLFQLIFNQINTKNKALLFD